MNAVIRISAAAIAALAFSAGAQADTVKLTGFRDGLRADVDLDVPRDLSTKGGEYVGLWNGNSFHSLCVDVMQNISFGSTYTDYTAVSAATHGFSATQESLLNKLYTNHYAASRASNASAAAFQIAAWEIAYDGNGTLDIGGGSFIMGAGGSAAAKTTASGWLGTLAGASTGNWTFTVLESGRHQDLLVAMPVPEPSSMAMLLAGLGVMGAIARRRKSPAA